MRNTWKSAATVLGTGLLLVSTAWGQEVRPPALVEASGSGGAAIPLGSFRDAAKTGAELAVGAGYSITSRLTLGGEVGFERHDAVDSLDDYEISHVFGTGKLRFLAAGDGPYVRAGVGVAHFVLNAPSNVQALALTRNDFAFALGVGYQSLLRGTYGGFAEASWMTVVHGGGDRTHVATIRAGLIVGLGSVE